MKSTYGENVSIFSVFMDTFFEYVDDVDTFFRCL